MVQFKTEMTIVDSGGKPHKLEKRAGFKFEL